MRTVFPPKLKPGDGVRVIAPSCSMKTLTFLTKPFLKKTEERFAAMGLHVTYGKHVMEIDDFEGSSIRSRVADLHDAFRDPSVQLIHCVRGGWSSNQLLGHLDYNLLRRHPKILCGFSDITALGNAIFARTGLVTYSGPSYYTFGFSKGMDYTLDGFQRCLFRSDPFIVRPSSQCVDVHWFPQQKEKMHRNPGYWIIQKGSAEGTILGGNLCTFNLLQGTAFMPNLRGSILFVEDDDESLPHTFDRDLQSLIHQPAFRGVRGLVIGRFQKQSGMTRRLLEQIIASKRELRGLPVIANVDFGHTQPVITFPVGGGVRVGKAKNEGLLEILQH